MRWLLAVEVVFVGVLLAGVALVYVPAALILAGVLGVVAVERASVGRRSRPAAVTELRRRGAA